MKTIERINNKRFKVYDYGSKVFDRYTVVYLDEPEYERGTFSGRSMSEYPFSPQGFGCSCVVKPGPHLGRRIAFKDLPTDVQKCISQDCRSEETV